MRSETMQESQCQIGIDTTTTTTKSSGISSNGSCERAKVSSRVDSPLDFSTKKFKPEPLTILFGGGGDVEGLLKRRNSKGKKNSEKNSESNKRERSESLTSNEDGDQRPDSPCSRLRNILSMKSPLVPEDMAGTVLNLSSKESPLLSSIWCSNKSSESQLGNNSSTSSGNSSNGSNSSNNSNSSSPPLTNDRGSNNGGGSHHSNHSVSTMFLQSNSPRPATIPLSMIGGGATPTLGLPSIADLGSLGANGGPVGNGGGSDSSGSGSVSTASMNEVNALLGLPLPPSWGNGVYSPSISPILNQTVPTSASGVGGGLSLSFETSPTLFPHHHHIATGAASPALPFPSGLSLPLPNGGSPAGSKARTTRPFKAYPKDPLSFSSVGLYGLPLGTAPGTSEAVIHQQSNQAYAEFRKQMLTSSQFGKARRGTHRNSHSPYPSMDSLDDDHMSHMNGENGLSLLRANDSGSASDDGGSLCGKNRMGKSEQQLKDEAYWERRRKNNEAAKRSRDARRAKEDEIAIRAAFLEQENLKLRFEVCALKSETAKLRCMLYSS